MNLAELAKTVVKNVRDDELFNVPSDARWEREIAQALRQAYDAGREARIENIEFSEERTSAPNAAVSKARNPMTHKPTHDA